MNRAGRLRATYVALCSIILLLTLYLVLRPRDRIQYSIPELTSLQGVDEIHIERDGDLVQIVYFGTAWQIMPEGYRADPASMGALLAAMANLKLSELVSVTGNYAQYDLAEDDSIRVSGLKNGEAVRTFEIGKLSPTYDHTFIKMADDDRVFQTAGDLKRLFNRTREDLRDKLVLSFRKDLVTQIGAVSADIDITLERKVIDGGSDARVFAWSAGDGGEFDSTAIDDLLMTLSGLTAYSFMDPDSLSGDPIFHLTVSADKAYTLSFYEKRDNYYSVRSSQSEDPFRLFYAISEKIMNVFAEPDN